MQPLGRLGSGDFPNSVYARELRAGPIRLRFGPDLEPEYITRHLRRVRLCVRLWFAIGFVLCVTMTVAQTFRTGPWTATFWTQILATASSGTLALLAFSNRYERLYMPVGRLLVPLLGVLVAVLTAQGIKQAPFQLSALTTYVIAMFFFTGLMSGAATFAATAMIVVFAITSLIVQASMPFEMLQCILMLSLTAAFSAFVCRDVERSYRTNFIESGLIAELVARDGLTGLMNRRTFDDHLLRVWQQGQRDRRTIVVLMMDIDHFKAYNDSHGHQAGDAALRAVGAVFKEFARRPLDLAARYGGEEFAIILYDVTIDQVRDMSERIRRAVQEAAPTNASVGGGAVGVTISVGAALVAPSVGRTPAGAVQLADEALYEAKNAGRNRVVIQGIEAHRQLVTGKFKQLAG